MSRPRIVPVIEGHGEFESIRISLERVSYGTAGGEYLDVLRPIRMPRSQLVKQDGLINAVKRALNKLSDSPAISAPDLILALIDAGDDLPRELGPRMLGWARAVDTRADVACVLANLEYETWFVAAASSLTDYLDLAEGEVIPDDPEGSRCRAGRVERRFRGTYKKTLDQPRMTAAMDLELCRRRSPSFDKLCRELERRAN